MRSLRIHHTAAVSAAFVLVGIMAACGGGSGSGGAGAGGGGSAGGPSALCSPDVSGQAATVTITVRNTGATDLQIPTDCESPWNITAADGTKAPRGYGSVRCDAAPPQSCPQDCLDLAFTTLAAGAETTFTWNGLLIEKVDAVAERCPAAQPAPGEFCSNTCTRDVDAAPGMYTLTVKLYENDAGLPAKTVTFTYPDQTDIEVVFP